MSDEQPREPTGSHTTGAHAALPPAPTGNGWRRDLITAAIALALGSGGGAAVQAAASSSTVELERRVGVVEGRAASDTSARDVAAISATLSAMERRLGRIEDRLDRRSGGEER